MLSVKDEVDLSSLCALAISASGLSLYQVMAGRNLSLNCLRGMTRSELEDFTSWEDFEFMELRLKTCLTS
jgi:hypothetical protein